MTVAASPAQVRATVDEELRKLADNFAGIVALVRVRNPRGMRPCDALRLKQK